MTGTSSQSHTALIGELRKEEAGCEVSLQTLEQSLKKQIEEFKEFKENILEKLEELTKVQEQIDSVQSEFKTIHIPQ